VHVVREEGGRTLLARVLGETVYRRLALLERDLAADSPSEAQAPNVSYRWLEASGLDAYEALRPGRREQALERLAVGHRCFGTWVGDQLVAVRWLATGTPLIEYLAVRLPLAPGEIYLFDTFTDPALRRQGISAATQVRLFAVLRAEGYLRALRAVLPENYVAVRDAASAGFKPSGKIGFIRLGPWRHEFVRRREIASVEPGV
jgi:GNAT superfamily N-acetyltransferase